MTLKELSQLYWLKKEISKEQERLEVLKAKAGLQSPALSAAPGGAEKKKLEHLAAEIADLKTVIELKKEMCIRERARLEHYIATIEDSYTRQIFVLRFIEGYSWQGVAMRIGGGNTKGGVKMTCTRYIKNH